MAWEIILTTLALLAGGFVKGSTSLGLPLVAMPIIASIFDARTAILILSVPLVICDAVYIGKEWRQFHESKRFIGLILFAVVGVVIGARLLARLDVAILSLVLGSLTLLFVVTAWFGPAPTLSPRVVRLASPLVGLAAGILRGVAGASGPIVAVYLYSIGVSRYLFGLLFNTIYIIIDVSMVLALYRLGLYTAEMILLTLVAVVPAFIGIYLGIRLQACFADRTFMRGVLAVLAATSFHLIMVGLGIHLF
jgi:uncharacterized membrane protein YfcA